MSGPQTTSDTVAAPPAAGEPGSRPSLATTLERLSLGRYAGVLVALLGVGIYLTII